MDSEDNSYDSEFEMEFLSGSSVTDDYMDSDLMSFSNSSSEDESNPRGPHYITREVRRRQRAHDLREVVRLSREEQRELYGRRRRTTVISSDASNHDESEESVEASDEPVEASDESVEASDDEIQRPTEPEINQQPTGSVINQQPTGSVINQQPTGSVVSQQPTGSVINQQPTGSVINQQPTGSVINQQPTGSVINQQATASGSGIAGQPSGSPIVQQPSTSAMPQGSRQDEDEIFSCIICLETLTSVGDHRPACLKCGHIFGEHCIHKWIKNAVNKDGRRCPTCNALTCLKDIRIVYAKNLIAVDTAELLNLQQRLAASHRENNLLQIEVDNHVVNNELLRQEVANLGNVVENLKRGQPSTTSQSSPRKCLKTINVSKKPSCRVMTYNKNNMILAVSQNCESPLFSKPHVIRKVNASILEMSRECIYAHKKQIRDMTFHPIEHNLLASVSLDKCVNLSDMMANMVAATLEVDEPLWSCCWAGDNSNLLIAGGQGGSVYYIDRRYMKTTLTVNVRAPACVSLVTLPPSRSRSFIRGGFLKARMDALSIFENHSENSLYNENKLSLKGLWSSACFDSRSNFILSTAKPSGNKKSIRHIVSKITDYKCSKTTGETIEPVATFYGGDKATLLSRSCLVPSNKSDEDTLACSYDEKTKAVKLYSINSVKNIHNFYVKEPVLDLCYLDDVMVEGRRALASLSESSVSIFSV